jgi:hypothetical protein
MKFYNKLLLGKTNVSRVIFILLKAWNNWYVQQYTTFNGLRKVYEYHKVIGTRRAVHIVPCI